MAFAHLKKDLGLRKQQGLFRKRSTLGSPQDVNAVLDNERYLSFCANDYLGLANHPEIVEAFQAASRKWGVGAGASHLVSGHHIEHEFLEDAIAKWLGRSRVLLFSTGYMANLGTVTALLRRSDTVLQDRLNHASLLDAGLLSGARFQRYLHNDIDSLEAKLAKAPDGGEKLIVTDGVFSMDGDVAPVRALAKAAREHDAWLMVDDAHGFGVLGQNGEGLVNSEGLGENDVQILVGTLGKAFGTAGAFVAGSDELIDYISQFARSYIYTTAMPPAIASATNVALRLVQEEPWRRQHLSELITHFRTEALGMNLQLLPSETPIQPVIVGDSEHAIAWSEHLKSLGLWVTAIRPPTVPAGSARLRVTFSANHSLGDVDRLLQGLCSCLQRWPVETG